MPEFFQGLLAAGVPFVVVVSLGIYIQQRWSARREQSGSRSGLLHPRS